MYGVERIPAATHPKNLQTVVVNEQFKQSDLKHYLQEQGLPHAEMADHLPCTVQPAPTVAFAVQTEASKVEISPKESADPAAS